MKTSSALLSSRPRVNQHYFRCAAAFLLFAAPMAVQGQFNYITNNGAITITGYTGPGGPVNVPAQINGLPVVIIGENAFSVPNSQLTSVTIPNSVTNIGDWAFDGCFYLTNVTIGANVATIGISAFYGIGLNNVIIPNSVTSIGDSAFANCYRLTSVTIGTNVATIGNSAFSGAGLASVIIPNSVTSIGNSAFDGCGNQASVTIGNSVTNIGTGAFSGRPFITVAAQNPSYSSLNGVLFDKNQTTLIQAPEGLGGSYTVADSVTNIGDSAFEGCSSLRSVTIGTNVATIGNAAFTGCPFTSITIPDSVATIGISAFNGCTSLTAITVAAQNPSYSSLNGVLFDKNQTTLIAFPGGIGGSYTIPDSVTGIANFAFSGSQLTSVAIPNTVISIGDSAFAYCGNLTNVTVGNGVSSIGAAAFGQCDSLSNVFFMGDAPGVDPSAFIDCDFLGCGYDSATIYYLPGTLGWSDTFAVEPTALWFLPQPLILGRGPGFGVQSNQFGFIISWATNVPVVVEATTNLTAPFWTPVATNALTTGASYFSEAAWTNYSQRYYRLRTP
jgi:hypothetical protein